MSSNPRPPAKEIESLARGTHVGGVPSHLESDVLQGSEWRGQLSPFPKRWQFLTLVTPEVVLGLGWVSLGYAQQAFGFGLERERSETFFRFLDLLPPRMGLHLAPEPLQGASADYRALWGGRFFRLSSEGSDLRVQGADPRSGLEANFLLKDFDLAQNLFVRGQTPETPRPISTVKTVLLRTEGELSVRDTRHSSGRRRLSLAQGLAALDFTEGFPPRHTIWKWGSALGWGTRSARIDGERGESEVFPLGLNLAVGNNLGGELENALWFDRDVPLLLPPVTFQRPVAPRGKFWTLSFHDPAGLIRGELEFLSRGVLENRNRLGLVRSDLQQHYGDWLGWIETPEARYELKNVAGILEDQDVLW